jgi:transitional endoplasmic reticulum ATPase
MPVSFDTYEKFKDRGMGAYRAGDYDAARIYLLQAAKAMTELAAGAEGELKEQREETARKLLALANSCKERKSRAARGGRGGPNLEKAGGSGEGGEEAPKDWVVRERPDVRFDDIAGLEDVKREIRLKMIYPVQNAHLAKRFGIQSGGGILLYGPPGTGKTMIAKAVAGEIDATFFSIKPSQVMSKWVGEAEQNIQQLFDQARGERVSVIFIDEVEALVPARRDSQSTVMQRLVPQILAELEGFDRKKPEDGGNTLLFIGATNEPWSIDPAMLRPGRLDEKIYVGLPDGPARRQMLDMYLAKRPLAGDVDLDALTQRLEGYSGADIKNLCHKAATIPFLASVQDGQERDIAMADVLAVLEKVRPSVSPDAVRRFDRFREMGTV